MVANKLKSKAKREEEYKTFLSRKAQLGGNHGFEPAWFPPEMYDFQRDLTTWSQMKGRSAIFADCGMGKTVMFLAFAENIVRKTNKRVLILTPLAVGPQTVAEGEKFGVDVHKSRDGKLNGHKITVTNYEQLHNFDNKDFVGVVCDESSILKNFKGVTKAAITEFVRTVPYRLLCTATAAPNDYIELGTSSEALGELGYMDMLSKFFTNNQKSNHPNRQWSVDCKWRFRGHAQEDFWKWVCSWARTVRKPSDLGYDDGAFILPELKTNQHVIQARRPRDGYLFDVPAITLNEQREERRRTIQERCEKAAELVDHNRPAICWCHLNDEGDLLEKLIPDAVQVSGSDSDEKKEERFEAFRTGKVRVMITKPKIGGLGLNWQHCAHQVFFPSHSFEQWYQSIRRSWRFGQKETVVVDVVTSEGEARILENLQRKEMAANTMFAKIVGHMQNVLAIKKTNDYTQKVRIPKWLKTKN